MHRGEWAGGRGPGAARAARGAARGRSGWPGTLGPRRAAWARRRAAAGRRRGPRCRRRRRRPCAPAERARRAQAAFCPALEALSLAGCHGVTGCGLAFLATPCGGAGWCAPKVPRSRPAGRGVLALAGPAPAPATLRTRAARRCGLCLGGAPGPPPRVRPVRGSAAASHARRLSDTRAVSGASNVSLTAVVVDRRRRGGRPPRGHGRPAGGRLP